jgi:hypothetical protein
MPRPHRYKKRRPIRLTTPWGRLTKQEREKLTALGHDEHSWNKNVEEPEPRLHLWDQICVPSDEVPWTKPVAVILVGDVSMKGTAMKSNFNTRNRNFG